LRTRYRNRQGSKEEGGECYEPYFCDGALSEDWVQGHMGSVQKRMRYVQEHMKCGTTVQHVGTKG
jgi:hypothetical protein